MASVEMNSFWRDRQTFVTGATGLVGGWLVRRLLDHGANVVCLARDWVPKAEFVRARLIDRVVTVRGDVRDQRLLERVLGEYQIDTVFHLAAQTIVPIANRNPVGTLETNIGGTWTLLEACRRSPTVKQIVIASSDKAYGTQPQLPYDEMTPLRGEHPYDASKACADLIAHMYATTFDVPVGITRCANVYGGGDFNWDRLVPGTIRSVWRGRNPLVRSDGRSVRDYFYVEDVSAAYICLAEALARQPHLRGQAFNFSNETHVTVLDMVQHILKHMNSNLSPEVRADATYEIPAQSLNAAKAREQLGWAPLFTLDDGLQRTIRWYQKFFEEDGKWTSRAAHDG